MLVSNLIAQYRPLDEVTGGSIAREIINGKLASLVMKCTRQRNGVTEHCVVKLEAQGVTVEKTHFRRCLDFGTSLSISVANRFSPNFGATPPAGALVQLANELALVAQERGVIRFHRVSDGAEVDFELTEGVPYYAQWHLVREVPKTEHIIVVTWPPREEHSGGQLDDIPF